VAGERLRNYPDQLRRYSECDRVERPEQDIIYTTPTVATATIATSGSDLSIAAIGVEGTGAPAGDFWIMFIGKTNVLAAATAAHVVARTAATQTVTAIAVGTDVYEACKYVYVQETTTYADTMVYAARTLNTDYTFNFDTGVFKRVSTGSFTDGAEAHITYWVIEAPNVVTDIGANSNNEDYRKVKIVRLGPNDEDLDPEDRRGEGKVYEFDRVNFSEMAGGVGFTEDDWDAGSSVTVTTLYDTSTGRIGTAKSTSPKHSGVIATAGYE
jgi:hypothetical protein